MCVRVRGCVPAVAENVELDLVVVVVVLPSVSVRLGALASRWRLPVR